MRLFSVCRLIVNSVENFCGVRLRETTPTGFGAGWWLAWWRRWRSSYYTPQRADNASSLISFSLFDNNTAHSPSISRSAFRKAIKLINFHFNEFYRREGLFLLLLFARDWWLNSQHSNRHRPMDLRRELLCNFHRKPFEVPLMGPCSRWWWCLRFFVIDFSLSPSEGLFSSLSSRLWRWCKAWLSRLRLYGEIRFHEITNASFQSASSRQCIIGSSALAHHISSLIFRFNFRPFFLLRKILSFLLSSDEERKPFFRFVEIYENRQNCFLFVEL